jgi:hypothetical protein
MAEFTSEDIDYIATEAQVGVDEVIDILGPELMG